MKKRIVYEGYYQSTELEELKVDWNDHGIDMAKIPGLHRKKHSKDFWGDGRSGKKVRITIEEL